MQRIQKRFYFSLLAVVVVLFTAFKIYLDYFPWAHGYKYGTSEWAGYRFAEDNNIKSAEACDDDPEMLPKDQNFQTGCREFFR